MDLEVMGRQEGVATETPKGDETRTISRYARSPSGA